MKADCVRPCKNCPFRKDSFVVLGKHHALVAVGGIEAGASFACHETILHTLGSGPKMMLAHLDSKNPDARRCAGALTTLKGGDDQTHESLAAFVAYHDDEPREKP